MIKAPSHFLQDTTAWWYKIVDAYLLEPHHLKLLRACCEAWDRAETARLRVKRDGMFYEDRFGQPKVHPGVEAERKSRDQFRQLLRELGLDVAAPNESRVPTPGANAHLRLHG